MTRKVTLTVEVTLSTNDELELVGDLEHIAVLHTKNCLWDNRDVDVYTIEDVDVSLVKSEEAIVL